MWYNLPITKDRGKIGLKKNEFESFCDELLGGQVNKVDYVRTQLRAKYKGNLDMLLVIKAEAQEDDYMQYMAFKVSILALIISAFDVINNLVPDTGIILINYIINIIYLLLIIYIFVKIGMVDKFTSVRKWRKYVLVVIDELIEESKYKEPEKKKCSDKKDKNK